MPNGGELAKTVKELRDLLKQFLGVLLDARHGFDSVLEKLQEKQKVDLLEILPGTTPESMDERECFYSNEPTKHGSDDPSETWLFITTQGELKRKNSPGGSNDIFIANMCLVAVYSFWEDWYRGEIERALHLQKNGIKAPIFGDVRWIRHSIVHHRGVAVPEIEKCEVLRWFKPGEKIEITMDQFRDLCVRINQYLDDLVRGI